MSPIWFIIQLIALLVPHLKKRVASCQTSSRDKFQLALFDIKRVGTHGRCRLFFSYFVVSLKRRVRATRQRFSFYDAPVRLCLHGWLALMFWRFGVIRLKAWKLFCFWGNTKQIMNASSSSHSSFLDWYHMNVSEVETKNGMSCDFVLKEHFPFTLINFQIFSHVQYCELGSPKTKLDEFISFLRIKSKARKSPWCLVRSSFQTSNDG